MRLYHIFIAALTLAAVLMNAGVSEAARKTVAVLGIENSINTSYGRQAAQELDAAITSALVQSGSYTVVERQQLETVLRELHIQSTGLMGDKAIQFGNLTGADCTVIGSVVSAGVDKYEKFLVKGLRAQVKLNLKIIDNTTGIIKFSEMIQGDRSVSRYEDKSPDGNTLLSNAVSDVARVVEREVKAANPIVGRVIKVADDKVYLNIGSDEGLQKGDSLTLYLAGDVISDPVTKEILAIEEETIGTLSVKEVHERYAIAKVEYISNQALLGTKCKVKRK